MLQVAIFIVKDVENNIFKFRQKHFCRKSTVVESVIISE